MATRLIPEYLKARIQFLPDTPGVYIFKNFLNKPVYIGKAISVRKRVMSHFRQYGETFSKEGILLSEVRSIDVIETPTEEEALLLEASLVKQNQPKFNKELKDDKSFPFLKITGEELPRLLIVRGRKSDGGKYFGPYTSGKLLRQAVSMLRRLFPMRTCDPLPDKVCLMYHIQQCKGPCEGLIDKPRYLEIVKELEAFLEGKRDALVKNLLKRMKEYSDSRDYEKAKLIYEQVRALSAVPQKSQKIETSVLSELMDTFLLPKLPIRIECFDISNISGKEAVGSMVVFVNGKRARSQYRRFRVRTVLGKIDDYEMMREIVRRRYARVLAEKQDLPDLVVIDGGRGHLAAAKGQLDALGLKELPILSIAKEHEHIFSVTGEGPHVLPLNSPALQLIRHLRDEAHRFAVTYHRKLHKKESMLSVLDRVPGVGPKTKEKLLRKFGTVSKMQALSEENLIAHGGLSARVARNLFQAFQQHV